MPKRRRRTQRAAITCLVLLHLSQLKRLPRMTPSRTCSVRFRPFPRQWWRNRLKNCRHPRPSQHRSSVSLPPKIARLHLWMIRRSEPGSTTRERFHTDGRLIEINATNVRLIKTSGRTCTVPNDRLSEADAAYVDSIRQQIRAARLAMLTSN